ncbi:MAG: DUF4143 domain-containing protein, partial [Patescibacteria group bacterium]|nr:DUF4143 domain-containing protein [Patescibacteria group bacterium]
DLSRRDLDEIMRLGTYPAVIAESDSRIREDILRNLATNYLYKDVYMFESIRNPRVFEGLIRMLALQIGSLVSVNELSVGLGISRGTVEKYLRLLEQSYVVRIVRSFSRNPKNEMKKGFKVFFVDIGIRNAVIDNVSPVEERPDKGAIFENFFVSERLKAAALESFPPSIGFWRSRQGAEIDVIEERAGKISAYECKWSETLSDSFPVFKKAYPEAEMAVVNPASLLVGIERKMI